MVFFQLLKNVTIPSGGVMPHIAPELLKNKSQGFALAKAVAAKPSSPTKKSPVKAVPKPKAKAKLSTSTPKVSL